MRISLALTDILILCFALQGLVLSGMLFYSAKKIESNRWVAAFILVIAITTLHAEAINLGIFHKYPQLMQFIPVLKMAIGPLIYFYTYSLVYSNLNIKRKRYHFLPLLLDAKYQIIYLLLITGALSLPFLRDWYFEPQMQNFLFSAGVIQSELPTFLSLVIYTMLSYKMLYRTTSYVELSPYKAADIKWLKTLLHLFFVVLVIYTIQIAFIVAMGWHNSFTGLLYIPVTLFIYWLGMSAYFRQGKMKPADVLEYNKAPAKIYFDEAVADGYHQQLLNLMEVDHLYLNPLLKLDTLATRLSLPEKAISSLLNQHLGKNFNDFVNEYRVEAAKLKLADPTNKQFTIAAIAYDCGFNSLATFQRCFKQFTGVTPSQYQNNIKLAENQINTAQIPI